MSLVSQEKNEQAERHSFAGRYTLLHKLGAGGMGVVYSALDASTGRTVALKQLLSGQADDQRRTAEALFQREFHTLSGLRHPRIIEVYDYGYVEQGPYYTMELLSGKGLPELAPLPYREACRLVRDVASSLALLHAHRLIHRDVSPGNVRLAADGRAKLLDFGALATFGACEDIIGTPPCIAPEALNGAPLDQRADLFSLGALLYWALTGRHAYPARSLLDLHDAWQVAVAPPSSVSAAVPQELDALVASLLTFDPLGRPASAAQVIERLNAIAALEPDNEEHARESYLLSSPMIGRTHELQQLVAQVDETLAGRGAVVLVHGASGIGKSRLLHELSKEAQLRRVTVVRASAETAVGSFSLVNALVANLFQVAPERACRAAEPYKAVLGHVSEALRSKLGVTELATLPDELSERRVVIQTALHAFFLALISEHPLLIAIDDVQAADPSSATFVAALAHEARSTALLLVTTRCTGAQLLAPGPLEALAQRANNMKLVGLPLTATETFIKALFGDVSNTGRLARWIHERSGGHPAHCIGLVQLLVKKELARYVNGTWVLPQEIASTELPSRLDELLEVKLAGLSPHAQRLAEALAVYGHALGIEHCESLLRNATPALVHSGLEELVADEILICEANRYRFRHDGMRAAAQARMDDDRRRALHRELGEALLASAREDDVWQRLEAGLHLLGGGDESRGADILASMGRAAAREQRAADDTALAVRGLSAALEIYEKEGRGDHARVPLLLALGSLSYYIDWRLAIRYGEAAIEVGFRVSGLLLATKLKRFLGTKLALVVALVFATIRFSRAKHRPKSYGLREVIAETCAAVPALAGVYAIALDVDRLRRLLKLIEPLLLFGRKHVASIIVDYCRSRLLAAQGREVEALELLRANASRLATTEFEAELGERPRKACYAGETITIAILETHAFNDQALKTAGKLDELHTPLWSMFAEQCRMIYFATRGQAVEARAHRDRVELYAIQGDSTWQTDILVPSILLEVAILSRDLVVVREAWEQLTRRSRDFPSLEPYAQAAQAAHLALQGNHIAAMARWPALLECFPERERAGWMSVRHAYAEVLNAAGRHEQARQVARDALARTTAEDRAFPLPYGEMTRQLALAEAGLGNFCEATRILDEFLEEHAEDDQPLVLGLFQLARAQVAIAMGDRRAFLLHWAAGDGLFRKTSNPVLIARSDQLAAEGARVGYFRVPNVIGESEGSEGDADSTVTLVAHPRALVAPEDQWARALELMVGSTQAQAGHLYLLRADELQLMAAKPTGAPPDEIREELLSLVMQARGRQAENAENTSRQRIGPPLQVADDDDDDGAGRTLTVFTRPIDQRQSGSYRLLVLTNDTERAAQVVGGVALLLDTQTVVSSSPQTANAIARALTARSSSAPLA